MSRAKSVSITWTSLGPQFGGASGKLNAIAFGPNPSTLYVAGGIGQDDDVANSTGIFKTTDGGITWKPANRGISDMTIEWLLDTPKGALLATTFSGGIYRSDDGAQSWSRRSSAQDVHQLLRVGTSIYAAALDGVYRSTDDGRSWTRPWPLFGTLSLAENGDRIFIGTIEGKVYGSVAGRRPVQLGTVPRFDFLNEVHLLVSDSQDPAILFASVTGIVDNIYSDGLAKSIDGGRTWSVVTLSPQIRGAQAILEDPAAPGILDIAGTGFAKLPMSGGSITYDSIWTGDSRSLTADPYDPASVYVLGDQGGIHITNAAVSRPITSFLSVNIVRSFGSAANTIVTTMQDFAPAVSRDGGATWPGSSGGDAVENGNAAINPYKPRFCYVIANGMNVSTDRCATFHTYGGTDVYYGAMAFAPNSSRAYVAAANGVQVARDGVHFLPTGWKATYPSAIAIDPKNAKHVLFTDRGGLHVSFNGGASFRQARFPPASSGYFGPHVAFDPAGGDMYAYAPGVRHLYRSVDGGRNFKQLSTVFPAPPSTPSVREHALLQRRFPRSVSPGGDWAIVAGRISGGRTLLAFLIDDYPYISWDGGDTIHLVKKNATTENFGWLAFWNDRLCAATGGEAVICSEPL